MAAYAATVFGEITSANVVGYATQPVTDGGLKCVGFQFADVGSAEGKTSLVNFLTSGITPGVYDTMGTDAPCVQFYNGIGYEFYYYISDAYDADGNEVTGWANGGGDIADLENLVGTGCWLRIPAGKSSAGTVTQAGEVLSADTVTIDLRNGLTLASNPFPTALDLSKVVTTGLVPGVYDTMEADAPSIQVYNGVGYQFYFYISDAFDADGNEVTGWANGGGDIVYEPVAAVGQAFWAKTTSAGKLTFSMK